METSSIKKANRMMVIFVAVYCSIFGFSKNKHTPTHYPAMWVFCGETSGQVSLTGHVCQSARSTCTETLRARHGLTRHEAHTRRSTLRVCIFDRSVEVRAKRKDTRWTHKARRGGRGCLGWSAAARGQVRISGSAGSDNASGPCSACFLSV